MLFLTIDPINHHYWKTHPTYSKASKNGDDTLLVVPFAGSGSECVAAKKENINFIGFEINEEYVALCNERLETV